MMKHGGGCASQMPITHMVSLRKAHLFTLPNPGLDLRLVITANIVADMHVFLLRPFNEVGVRLPYQQRRGAE
jgi:hypothetical protein